MMTMKQKQLCQLTCHDIAQPIWQSAALVDILAGVSIANIASRARSYQSTVSAVPFQSSSPTACICARQVRAGRQWRAGVGQTLVNVDAPSLPVSCVPRWAIETRIRNAHEGRQSHVYHGPQRKEPFVFVHVVKGSHGLYSKHSSTSAQSV